jgi:hypothetical protein
MWRIPVGTQIPVEVTQAGTDASPYRALKYAHLSNAAGPIDISAALFNIPNTLYKVVSLHVINTAAAVGTCSLRLSLGSDIVWEMQHETAALAASNVTYCDGASNSRIDVSAASELYNMLAPPWFDSRFTLEFEAGGADEIDVIWYEEYR